MDQTEALVKTIVEGLQEKKGKNIVTVDLTQLSGSICQYMIICEGSTPTQVSALSDSAWDFAHRGMDYGTVLLHIFLPELREFYNLENLWSDAKVTQIVDLD